MPDDLPFRLRNHVLNRGGPMLKNGAWDMMLEAAARIRELEDEIDELYWDKAGIGR